MNKWFSSHSIRNKFLYVLTFISILSASVTAGLLIYFESVDAERYHQDKLTLMSSIISPNLTAAIIFNDTQTINELISPTIETEGIFGAYVFDKEKQLVAQVNKNGVNLKKLSDNFKVETPLILEGEHYGSLVFYSDQSVVDVKLSFYKKLVAQLVIGTVIVSLIFSLILSRLITKHLSQLIDVAKKVTDTNDYTIRAPCDTVDEIGDLTDCFNSMLETVESRERALESKVVERTKALADANRKLHHQAHEDTLSGLPNRRSLYSYLNRLVDNKKNFCLLFIDLDGFKQVNDSLGHDLGDMLLKQASERIVSCVRAGDFVARLGGDEFTVVLNDIARHERIDDITQNILAQLANNFTLADQEALVSASVGITLFPQDGSCVDSLIKNADQAMYESKRQGKNCFHYFNQEMSRYLADKKQQISDLHCALKNNEFELHYQPIINLHSEKICKAEALIRWQHPSKGLIMPGDFLDTVEEEGLMDELGFWVAKQAADDALKWQKLSDKNIVVSINISPSQFIQEDNLLRKWLAYLDEIQLPKQSLVIEITENAVIENDANVHQLLNDIRAQGINIAIDDFGVGYSSLSYLQQLNLDLLKIDRAFIAQLTASTSSYGLCKGIIAIAKELQLTVVGEGIETKQQRDMLIQAGCDYGQGYLFSKPLPCAEFESAYIIEPPLPFTKKTSMS
ncbi:EAL domain-containing protein [Thalassotalea sp. PLHSN55]|uniref:EAL domain-containing protein n=1 Tax=Thalassotalea sp. PLHSN55 TaxID=3435888 RepID=UPI003F863661